MRTIAPSKSAATLRVLLIEDSFVDGELIGLELREQGYDVDMLRVETRQQIEQALQREWDVVLCDHSLPTMDTLSALSLIQKHGLDLPFIIVSGAIDETTAVEIMRAGAHDFLFKNALGRLGAVIDRELREANVRAESRRLQQQLLLTDRLSSVGMLAAGVAHEINNPLSYVVGNLEFAIGRLRKTQAPELDEVLEALEHAQEGSDRIRHTTRDLRVFVRTDDQAERAVNVRKVMESSIKMAWNEIRHRAHLNRDFLAVPSVAGNENRLGQVFLNLLVNAAQALPEGQEEDNEISVSIRARDGKVLIEVKDTGPGIPAEQLKRIFEPFYTTKPVGVGSGIGLSICESIVSDLGGGIEVESTIGIGTLFRITLPALSASLSLRPSKPDVINVRRSRILAIDDEPALCAVIRRLLSPQHEVVTFVDAREALRLLKTDGSFDVIFCDLMMPKMSGIDFYDELQELDPELASRTVFLTGGAFSGPGHQFLSSISNRVVEKPFDARSLEQAVANVLDGNPRSGTWPVSEPHSAAG